MRKDPVKWEMARSIRKFDAEADAFDVEAAIYWFASDYHGGQSSNLYSVLSMSEYKPGPMMRGPNDEGMNVAAYYNHLVSIHG